MTDHTTLIAELREHAEWARAELNQARAELLDRAADALELAAETKPMECAPKDGTAIEIWLREFTTPSVGYWSAKDEKWITPDDYFDLVGTPYAWRHLIERPRQPLASGAIARTAKENK